MRILYLKYIYYLFKYLKELIENLLKFFIQIEEHLNVLTCKIIITVYDYI